MAAKIEDLAAALAGARSPFDLQHMDWNSVKEGAADLVKRLQALEAIERARRAQLSEVGPMLKPPA